MAEEQKTNTKLAVIELSGSQFTVREGDRICVNAALSEPGSNIDADKVLVLNDGSGIEVGAPSLDSAKVSLQVESVFRGPKIKVFKKKRRKGYRKTIGHRQDQTSLIVNSISK
jgi:large subunit ribosomal protein L21